MKKFYYHPILLAAILIGFVASAVIVFQRHAVEVKVEPGKVLATAETKALGQTFDVTIDGAFSVADGDLYYKARRISARGLGLNALSLDSILPDILVARANSLPLGLAFESVEARDGVVVLTAGK